MQLTNEILAQYVGGDMEIQNEEEDYLFRGLIKKIGIEDRTIKVEFEWLAKSDGGRLSPGEWSKDKKTDYQMNLTIFAPSDIGERRLCFISSIVGELVVIFPPDGSHLDPKKVKGL